LRFNAKEEFGKKGKIKVKGKINGFDFSSTLMPAEDGTHFLLLTKEVRQMANIDIGDRIQVEIELDNSVTEIVVPDDFNDALMQDKGLYDYFNALPPSHKKEFIVWITEAKKADTRVNRIKKAITLLKN
jgi:hypothetical protein